MMDRYGREVIDHGEGKFSVPGIEIVCNGPDGALDTFNAMQPEDWVLPDTGAEPLDPVGALATLLAITSTPSLEDIANAVRLTPSDLIFEAEAWKAAQDQ